VVAYIDCRRNKRTSASALAFEDHLERHLCDLHDELIAGTYQPGRSICFVITHPRPREVWAAEFRDRVVHHLLYNRIAPRFYARFTADSCACIPGRGTLYAARRLEHQVRSITQNWSRPAHYLKCDLANFFVSIDKHVIRAQLAAQVSEPWWMRLAETVLMHDPRVDFELRGRPELLARVPPHKRLTNAPGDHGLPIGNLSSQFFANVLLNDLDQHIKHRLRAPHYVRYVDDFILLSQSTAWLNAALADITTWLPQRLHVALNPSKTILQPVDRGVDFVGHVIKPWRRTTRPGTVERSIQRTLQQPEAEVFASVNSTFGLFRQASHSHADRARLANAAKPYIVRIGQTGHSDGGKVRSTEAPLSTITTKAEHLLCTPTLVVNTTGHPGAPVSEPLRTVTTGGHHALVAAFLAKHYTGVIGSDLEDPIGTVTATDHHSLVASNLVKLRGTSNSAATDEPLHTISAGGQHHAEVRAFLTAYYGSDQDTPLDDPMHTVTTKPRFGLVSVSGQQYAIADIGMRMLQPRELYNAQGFPASYIIDRGADGRVLPKDAQVRMCGNSVCPPLSRALVASNYSERQALRAAA